MSPPQAMISAAEVRARGEPSRFRGDLGDELIPPTGFGRYGDAYLRWISYRTFVTDDIEALQILYGARHTQHFELDDQFLAVRRHLEQRPNR